MPSPRVGSSTAERPLSPPTAAEAQRHFDVGLALYADGDLRGALTEFRRAHEQLPANRVLYNLGVVSQELYDWAGASRYYRDYLDGGGTSIPSERRRAIERTLIQLAERVGRLVVEIRDGPAELLLDDRPVAASALGQTIAVNPGRRRVRATFGPRQTELRVVEVASGENLKLVFHRPGSAGRPVAPPALPGGMDLTSGPPAPLWSNARVWTWTATAVLAAGSVASGLLARRSSEALARERVRSPVRPNMLAMQQDRTRGYAIAADSMAGVAVVLGVVSLVLSLR